MPVNKWIWSYEQYKGQLTEHQDTCNNILYYHSQELTIILSDKIVNWQLKMWQSSFEFDNIWTLNVFNRFEIQRMF